MACTDTGPGKPEPVAKEFIRELASDNRDPIFKIACTEGEVSKQLGLDGIALAPAVLRSRSSLGPVELNYEIDPSQASKSKLLGRSVMVAGLVDDGTQRITGVVYLKERATGKGTSEWCIDAFTYDLGPPS